METITFYSYKGGSGRTLLVANVARYLASLGKRVVAIDFDLEAPGLHEKLRPSFRAGIKDPPFPKQGVVDYLLALADGSEANIRDYLLPIPQPHGTSGELLLMPAGSAPTGAYWKSLTTLHQRLSKFYSDSDGFGIAACLLELKVCLEEEIQADYLLIDARTGITELSGLTTTLLADKVVCIMIDNCESLSGTQRVIRSFFNAPRLQGQDPIIIYPVLSRVENRSRTFGEILDYLNDHISDKDQPLGLKHLFVLRTDPELASSDQFTHGESRRGRVFPMDQDYFNLLRALAPADDDMISLAAKRVSAIPRMKAWLLGEGERRNWKGASRFDAGQIGEGIEIGSNEKRYADLVVYGGRDRTEILLVLEFVENLPNSQEWQWWETNTNLRCVILFAESEQRRIFSRANKRKKFVERDKYNRTVRWPISYSVLDDPGEPSVERMLLSVQKGETDFIDFLVEEWQHASFLTLHGSGPYNPTLAQRILDGLANVSDAQTEMSILIHTGHEIFDKYDGKFGRVGYEELLISELHIPLWWRFSVSTKIDSKVTNARESMAHADIMNFLARDLMGLVFDQDGYFRREARKLVQVQSTNSNNSNDLYKFSGFFRERELKYQLSDELPPETIRRAALSHKLEKPGYEEAESVWKHAEQISHDISEDAELFARLFPGKKHLDQLIIQNFLGSYDPDTCQVTLYSRPIRWIASTLEVDERALVNVVFIHEMVYAVCHLGQDLDGNIWENFGVPPARSINYRPSILLETIANYFTYRMVTRLEDKKMMMAFKRLDEYRPVEYQSWRNLQNFHVEEIRKILMKARNPSGQTG